MKRRGKRKSQEARQSLYLKLGKCAECGKDRYPSRKVAKTAVSRMTMEGGRRVPHFYRCGGYWHFTLAPAIRVRTIREQAPADGER